MDRINVLAKKSKCEGLTEEEKIEQKLLREEYLVKFREHFKGHLDSIKFVDDVAEDKECKNRNSKN